MCEVDGAAPARGAVGLGCQREMLRDREAKGREEGKAGRGGEGRGGGREGMVSRSVRVDRTA
mgnify:CR=1 FL=1